MGTTEPKHRDWIKLWIKESLMGSIREDLTTEERSVWYDFLLLAGNCRTPGVIAANENTAIPVRRIAGILNISESLVNRCIRKFLDSDRIEQDLHGIIHIKNWEKYQYSDYDRVKRYRQETKQEAPKKTRKPGEKIPFNELPDRDYVEAKFDKNGKLIPNVNT